MVTLLYKYKKHPEFNILTELILSLFMELRASHIKKIEYFTKEILPKRENPVEYFDAIYKFIHKYD